MSSSSSYMMPFFFGFGFSSSLESALSLAGCESGSYEGGS